MKLDIYSLCGRENICFLVILVELLYFCSSSSFLMCLVSKLNLYRAISMTKFIMNRDVLTYMKAFIFSLSIAVAFQRCLVLLYHVSKFCSLLCQTEVYQCIIWSRYLNSCISNRSVPSLLYILFLHIGNHCFKKISYTSLFFYLNHTHSTLKNIKSREVQRR